MISDPLRIRQRCRAVDRHFKIGPAIDSEG
jgi:hypothetical protein